MRGQRDWHENYYESWQPCTTRCLSQLPLTVICSNMHIGAHTILFAPKATAEYYAQAIVETAERGAEKYMRTVVKTFNGKYPLVYACAMAPVIEFELDSSDSAPDLIMHFSINAQAAVCIPISSILDSVCLQLPR